MYVAIDIGTSSLKAALVQGASFWVERMPLALIQSGVCAEQDPRQWLSGLAAVLPRLLERSGVTASQIQALSVSSHSPSLVPVDAAGEAVYPCLTWQDRRALRQAEQIRQLTGEFSDPSFFEPKILWIKQEKPEVYAKTKAFLQPKDFVIFHLTGEMIIDRAAALFSKAHQLKEIDGAKLPRPVKNWEVVGQTTSKAKNLGLVAGIPVVAGGIDAYVEALGAGLIEDGQFGDVTGTSTCLSYCLNENKKVPGAAAHVIPECSLYILPMSSGGGTLAWYLHTLGGGLSYADLDGVASQAPPGANGLLFLPYLAGERSPIWDEGAKGVFFGITKTHNKADFLRAVLEGTAFAIRHSIDSLAEQGLIPREVKSTGGGSRLKVWNQIKADVTGLPYEQLEMVDGALLGGVLLGALAIEKRPIGDLVKEYVRSKHIFTPHHPLVVYDELYEKYKKLYESTKELMH
mgnify:FL=1